MAKPGLQPVTISSTFQGWLDRTNEIVSLIQSETVTASVTGDVTGSSGNPVSGTIIGSFGANTIISHDLLRTDNIAPKIGSSAILINGQITANTSLQTAAIFRSTQGARTTYASATSNWLLGYENVSTNSFVIDNGVGATKFRLTTDGNLFLSGNITSQTMTAVQFNGNANTATQLATPRAINGVLFDGSGPITITASTNQTLTRGTYLTGSNFNGSIATTWAVDADSNNIPNKVVVRNASGNFNANVINASSFVGNLTGNATTVTNGVYTSRLIETGNGLQGGGNLSADRLLTLDYASAADARAGINTVKAMTPARTIDSINTNAIRGFIVFNGVTGEVLKSRNLTLVKSGTGNYNITCDVSIRTGSSNWGVVITNIDDGVLSRTLTGINSGTINNFQNNWWNAFATGFTATGFSVRSKRTYSQWFSFLVGNDNGGGNAFGVQAIDPEYIALVVF
jgi:hypothetical protein